MIATRAGVHEGGDSIVCGNPAQALKARRLARISVRVTPMPAPRFVCEGSLSPLVLLYNDNG